MHYRRAGAVEEKYTCSRGVGVLVIASFAARGFFSAMAGCGVGKLFVVSEV